MKGAYVHIPFCEHICYYCDFNKYFIKNQPITAYLKALDNEMAEATSHAPFSRPETLFIGGGTPTALDDEAFTFLMNSVHSRLFQEDHTKEFTIEINPENLNASKLEAMKRASVNRLSIGVQTFDDRLLQEIGRKHTRQSAIEAISLAKRYGFDNLSIDLMFGLPGQTKQQLEASLDEILAIQPQHVSIYSLQIEPRTIFYNRLRKGKLTLPGQDIEADMYEYLIDFLGQHGIRQYEISNFAIPGYESQHNLIYWNNEEYYGFGAGAHGYIHGNRVVNARAVKGYMQRIAEQGHARIESHPVTAQEKIEEEMFLGLRKIAGVNKQHFLEKFHHPIDQYYRETIDDLVAKGLLVEKDDWLRLSRQGIFLGNEVFEAFLA
ncbi:radical SAM family heme chaperone HemW [Pullulanibacillus camelliae]|uniref:radical SAM family heme chaperone HemW n=1 Tax=Pullulanibacillus camelliae TaxID=1707096 RepID=UPI001E2917D0|nr:radical SAM family heme chaperone HemW [Pullulanibacillus camelliae]